jgi:hypothetical protein
MSDEELRQLIASNARSIQAMLEQRETDRLQRETDRLQHEEQMRALNENMAKLTNMQEGLINLTVSIDEDRPTVLRRLMSIENKVDLMLEQNRGNA